MKINSFPEGSIILEHKNSTDLYSNYKNAFIAQYFLRSIPFLTLIFLVIWLVISESNSYHFLLAASAFLFAVLFSLIGSGIIVGRSEAVRWEQQAEELREIIDPRNEVNSIYYDSNFIFWRTTAILYLQDVNREMREYPKSSKEYERHLSHLTKVKNLAIEILGLEEDELTSLKCQ